MKASLRMLAQVCECWRKFANVGEKGKFANVGENLANSLLQNDNYTNTVIKVTPIIMRIELTQDMVYKEILKLKPNNGALTTFLQSY